MNINYALISALSAESAGLSVTDTIVGNHLSGVRLSNGAVGVASTEPHAGDGPPPDAESVTGLQAAAVIGYLAQPGTARRSVALATVNAVNQSRAAHYPLDTSNEVMFDALGIERGSRVAMVGYFSSLLPRLAERGALVEIVDRSRGMGEPDDFNKKLGKWADALLLTGTSILNNTMEEILNQCHPGVNVAILGPTTPLVPDAFAGYNVRILAGTVVSDGAAVFSLIAQGMGTRAIHAHSRKVYCTLPAFQTG